MAGVTSITYQRLQDRNQRQNGHQTTKGQSVGANVIDQGKKTAKLRNGQIVKDERGKYKKEKWKSSLRNSKNKKGWNTKGRSKKDKSGRGLGDLLNNKRRNASRGRG